MATAAGLSRLSVRHIAVMLGWLIMAIFECQVIGVDGQHLKQLVGVYMVVVRVNKAW